MTFRIDYTFGYQILGDDLSSTVLQTKKINQVVFCKI